MPVSTSCRRATSDPEGQRPLLPCLDSPVRASGEDVPAHMPEHASYAIEPTDDGDLMVVVDSFDEAAAAVLRSGQVTGLTLNYALGFRERDLEFLEPWPLRRLDLLARTITDLSPL